MWYIYVDDADTEGWESGVRMLHGRDAALRHGQDYRRMTTRIVTNSSIPWNTTGIVVKPESVQHIAMAEARGLDVLLIPEAAPEAAPKRGPGRPPKAAESELPEVEDATN